MSTPFETQVLEANAKYASTYKHSGLECPPLKKAVLVTCMDCRLDPKSAYGFELGEVTTIRNAGASGRDAARSALLTTHVLGVEEVLLIKHTRCGLLGVPSEVVHDIMKRNLGLTESKDVDDFEVLTFHDFGSIYSRGGGVSSKSPSFSQQNPSDGLDSRYRYGTSQKGRGIRHR